MEIAFACLHDFPMDKPETNQAVSGDPFNGPESHDILRQIQGQMKRHQMKRAKRLAKNTCNR